MEIEEFKAICSKYYGNFANTEWGKILFCNKNEITSYYKDGEIHTRKKVDCEIMLSKNGTLGACEKTYGILGGCDGYDGTAEELESLLIRFGFKEKEQISFFDVCNLID